MDTLGRALQEFIKDCMVISYDLKTFMTPDNIDIQEHVHNTSIKATTKLFHGSYSYLHFLPAHLIDNINAEEARLESLLKCIDQSQEEPFEPNSILPTQKEKFPWKLVLKAQPFQNLLDYKLQKGSGGYNTCKSSLATFPLMVDPIE
ncbi:hypothetical protein DFH28DRAFT_1177901 [Melampsora americana]|nr:hypothetical protein DFH28DRAFT_1177901 [Melampsora americana]